MKTPKRALIFHGTMGSPDGNWFPWLKNELNHIGYDVTVPTFPTPENQNLKNWTNALKDQSTDLNEISLVIGHSLGATLALHLLEQKIVKPTKTVLVSTVHDRINNKEYDELNDSFLKKFDWEIIKKHQNDINILHGNNDPYVPINQAEEVAQGLGIELQTIQGGGHLNAESGYDQFPLLLDLVNA